METLPSYKDTLYLKHHGILGQKWGVRRYQNKDGSLTLAGRERYGADDSSSSRNEIELASDTSDKKKFKLTDKQKKMLLTGAAVAGGILAAYGAYRMVTAGDMTKSFLYDKNTGLMKQLLPHTEYDDILNTNPHGTNMLRGNYFTNCSKCSAVFDLRRRGFNVEAPEGTPISPQIIDKYYKNAHKQTVGLSDFMGERIPKLRFTQDGDNAQYLFDKMTVAAKNHPKEFKAAQALHADMLAKTCEDLGPNARGHVSVYFTNGGGHSIAFQNDATGKTSFIDSQIVHVSDYIKKNGNNSKTGDYFKECIADPINPFMPFMVTRTDNATPDYKFLLENNIIKNTYDAESVRNKAYFTTIFGSLASVSAGSLAYKTGKKDNTKSKIEKDTK